MSLTYKTQNPVPFVGSKNSALDRIGVNLASTYGTDETTTPTKSFKTGGHSKLTLDINYTMGAAETTNSIEMKVEGSPDGTNWYRLPIDTTVTQSTLTAREWTFVGTNAAAATISVILDIAYKWMRVSFKETGVITNVGNVYCEGTLSGF